jgi:hypothetical protein
MIKYTVLIFTSIVLTGCANFGNEYKYLPRNKNEAPATIEYIKGVKPEQKTTVYGQDFTAYDYSIRTYKINGDYTYAGSFATDKSEAMARKNQIQLSPGKTTITFLVGSQEKGTTFDATINIKSGEHYKLRINPPKAMVTDSSGNVLQEVTIMKKTIIHMNGAPIEVDSSPVDPVTEDKK